VWGEAVVSVAEEDETVESVLMETSVVVVVAGLLWWPLLLLLLAAVIVKCNGCFLHASYVAMTVSMTDGVKLPRGKSDSSKYKRAVRNKAAVVDAVVELAMSLVDGDAKGDSLSSNTVLLVPAVVVVVVVVVVVLAKNLEEW
jgi:hypothetical protein